MHSNSAQAGASAKSREPVSAIVTTFNEEARLLACLESLAWCDEILVVDSFSTDRTPEIARSFPKVRFIQHTYYGAAAQKNRALDQAIHPWVLILDADEVCPPALRAEIEAVLSAPTEHDAFVMRRNVWFMGCRIRFSGFRRDRVTRLFRREIARYQNRRVHPRVVVQGRERPADYTSPVFETPLEHNMVISIAEYLERTRKYGYWNAAQDWREGKRIAAWTVVMRPLWRFVRTWVVQGGILDGFPGFVFCAIQSMGTFVRCATLWGWHVGARHGLAPDLPAFDTDEKTWRIPASGG